MDILLMGEFSGFYKNLKNGLENLGHKITLFSNGDSWKKIDGATNVLFKKDDSFNHLKKVKEYIITPYLNKSLYTDYDIVQWINPILFTKYINLYMFDYIQKNNKKVYLSACGSDYFHYKAYMDGKLKYYAHDESPNILKQYTRKWIKYQNTHIAENVNGIIPISYDYSAGYSDFNTLRPTLPLPLQLSNFEYKENEFSDKIVFFHGLSRESFKGTKYIRAAMEKLKDAYPNDVDIIINGKMPYREYLNLLKSTNVVIDQCKCYGYGMNAIIAMAMGKVVLSGIEEEAKKDLNITETPIINIRPDIDYIYSQLEHILQHKRDLCQIGYASRKYVECYHDNIKVAQQYIDIWSQ